MSSSSNHFRPPGATKPSADFKDQAREAAAVIPPLAVPVAEAVPVSGTRISNEEKRRLERENLELRLELERRRTSSQQKCLSRNQMIGIGIAFLFAFVIVATGICATGNCHRGASENSAETSSSLQGGISPQISPVQSPTSRPIQVPTMRPVQSPTPRPIQAPTLRPVQPPTLRPSIQTPTLRPEQPPTSFPTQSSCELKHSCLACLDSDCFWTWTASLTPLLGSCVSLCQKSDIGRCYGPGTDNEGMCTSAQADQAICSPIEGCLACTKTMLSDGISTCSWYSFSSGSFCASDKCRSIGCGTTNCNTEI